MTSSHYQRRCDICSGELKKNGKTKAGKTRYRCKSCGTSSTAHRQGLTKEAQMKSFINFDTG
ncbi:transposase-like zinc-binding domain-containing protein [Arcanobacterium phocae]|uniref:transposase-like zinc-binding domain-containing protein n=1 Tax=Arcanobacterium phocae TaxID=131112 RepID=UPI003F506FCE